MKRKSKKFFRGTILGSIVILLLFCLSVVYAMNSELPDIIKAELSIGDPKEHEDYAGKLIIESVGIDIPCIQTIATDFEMTELAIHKSNCAAKIWYPLGIVSSSQRDGTWIIADHDFQGFSAIMECQKGDEVLFCNVDGTEWKYVVTDMFEGYIKDGILFDGQGNEFLCSVPENIVLMTCYPEANVQADRDDRRFFVCAELAAE